MNQETNEMAAFSITQVTEAGNSNHMEKLGFQKTLNEVREKGIVVKQLTTEIESKLIAAGKKSSCTVLQKWTKSIINHFWLVCSTNEGNEQLLQEKWGSVLFHVPNTHSWTTGDLFTKCEHPELANKTNKIKGMAFAKL